MVDRVDGVYEDIPSYEYHAAPRLNFSTLKLMEDCPEQCFLKSQGVLEDKDSDEMAFGRAYHSYVLTPKLFKIHYYVVPKMRRAGKEWEEVIDSTGLTPDCIFWTEDELRMKAMRAALANHPTFPGLIADSKRELTIYFTQNGIACKARIDIYNPKLKILGDLKTAKSVKPEFFVNEIFHRRYHQQMAWYGLALNVAGFPVDDYVLVAQRKDPGYGLIHYPLTELTMRLAFEQNAIIFTRYLECHKTKKWPSYPEGMHPVYPPDWFIKNNKENDNGTESDESN